MSGPCPQGVNPEGRDAWRRGGNPSGVSQDDLGDIARRLRAAGAARRDVTEIRVEFRDFKQAATAGFNAMREDFLDFPARFG